MFYYTPLGQLVVQGVVQTHKAIIGASSGANEFDRWSPDDNIVCYLPMAWVGDFMISVGQVMVAGACLNCPEGPDTVQMDVKEMGPFSVFRTTAFMGEVENRCKY